MIQNPSEATGPELVRRIQELAWHLGSHQDDLPEHVFTYFENEYTTIEDMATLAETYDQETER